MAGQPDSDIRQPRFACGHACRPVVPWTLAATVLLLTGCYVPLRSVAIPARKLSDEFRMPLRTAGPPLNFSSLTVQAPPDYRLGPGDKLDVTVPGLYPNAEIRPIRTEVMASGEIHLPAVGAVPVGGLNLLDAQRTITRSYANGFLVDPRVSLTLAEKATVGVLVLGKVKVPGVHVLAKYENDVGHALAAAGGLAEDAADLIEVHRRCDFVETLPTAVRRLPPEPGDEQLPAPAASEPWVGLGEESIVRIPLRGMPSEIVEQHDVTLRPGDVVVIPSRRNQVFFVVGKLGTSSPVRFTVGDRERELGAGFVLPRDREVDVVTAVAMAGYIDPIDSPSTVTLHRTMPDGRPFLIKVNLIRARYDARENVLVQAGDIIYLNPDAAWWTRRLIDRLVPDLFTLPYRRVVGLSR